MNENYLDQLGALRRDYAARLPARAADLAERFAALRDAWCPERADELRRMAHNLAGSGASYGFPAVSDTARKVEHELDAAMAEAPRPSPAHLDRIGAALRSLCATVVDLRPAT